MVTGSQSLVCEVALIIKGFKISVEQGDSNTKSNHTLNIHVDVTSILHSHTQLVPQP